MARQWSWGSFPKHISYRTCTQCNYLRYRQKYKGWEPERRKWHFTYLTGGPKQKFTIGWSDFVHWFQSFIIKICTLMDTFVSRRCSSRVFFWYIYIYIYIYIYRYIYRYIYIYIYTHISPKMSLMPFWFSPLVMYNYSNESFWECIKQSAYFISIIG